MYTRFHHDQTHLLSLIMLQPLCHVTSSIADMSPHLEGMEFPLRMVLYCVFYEFRGGLKPFHLRGWWAWRKLL